MKNGYGSTALHIAAIVGNTEASNLLIKKHGELLNIKDGKDKTPLEKACEYMHVDTIVNLLKAANDEVRTKKESSLLGEKESSLLGAKLLIHAISAKDYDLAKYLVKSFPDFAVGNDYNVLTEMAKTFPSGLDYGETLIYPIMGDICSILVEKTKKPYSLLVDFYRSIKDSWDPSKTMRWNIVNLGVIILFGVPPIKNIVEKKREWEKAKEVLKLVCDEIDKKRMECENANLESVRDEIDKSKLADYYKQPFLEAACQNACEVVDEILARSAEAIRYKDKSGYDIIQLAVIHRSEKIYNLIYMIGERKSIYRTIEDSSKNNMLHLAGKLAPSHKLKRSKGAAFQLQRELQWREEVKKIVFPTHITNENIFMETPDMVFTREHENLVKEGEKWMRAVAESCSITASLIITIVFAAAITVPGGSNQETGLPLFTEDIAFTIFALSDAVSLFASSTALLMFLSILTGRFAEQDFLVSLPRRMNIGLCTLMISTTAMMVAFGATMFIVFCGRKPWMLAPICVSAFLPIVSFATLQVQRPPSAPHPTAAPAPAPLICTGPPAQQRGRSSVPAAPPLHCRRSLLRRSSSALKNRFDFSGYALNLVSDNVVLLKLFFFLMLMYC
ncbi:hypothetical protein L1887_38461 [Cichorium endivia]|nr:hypothetical protein L1887_38461 [Cichorium endivia]